MGDSAAIVADTGVVVPADDALALLQGMTALIARLGHEGSRLRDAARARIVTGYSVAGLVQRTLNQFESLA